MEMARVVPNKSALFITILTILVSFSKTGDCPDSLWNTCRNCTVNNECFECRDGYYVHDGLCLDCFEGCSRCDNNSVCIVCKVGRYLNTADCMPCSFGCNECSGFSTNCSSCIKGFTLDSKGECYSRWSLYYLIGTLLAISLLFWMLIAFAKCLVGQSLEVQAIQPIYPESILTEDVYPCVSPIRASLDHIGKTSDRQDLSGVD